MITTCRSQKLWFYGASRSVLKYMIVLITLLIQSNVGMGQIPESAAIDSIVWDTKWNKPTDPGYALGIFRDGKMYYGRGYGLANLEYNIPISTKSVFRIASVSKQFTAACIVLLVERGQLRFDEKLHNFFPQFPNYAKGITIGHLLHHTSGLRDYQTLANLKGLTNENYYSDQDIIRWLTRQKALIHKSGEQYRYCNSGYWLLAKIVEKITETDFVDFARTEIFTPLKMNDTHYHDDFRRVVRNRATGHAPATSGYGEYEIRETNLVHIGNSGVYSSVDDLKKWDDAYYDSTVFSKDFWSMMIQKGVLENGDEVKYAGGLNIFTYKGLRVIGHGGSLGSQAGFRSQFIRFPDQRLSIVILANRSDADPWSASGKIADILLKDEFKLKHTPSEIVETIRIESGELSQFTGHYWNREKESRCVITIKNDTLRYEDTMKGSYTLIPTDKYEFYKRGNNQQKIKFRKEDDGSWTLLEVSEGQIEVVLPFEPRQYTFNELDKFLGDYYSEELETSYHLKLGSHKLVLSINNRFVSDLQPISENMFLTHDNGVFYFKENDQGEISGFDLEYFLTRIDFVKK